jgi:hypothetical protein
LFDDVMKLLQYLLQLNNIYVTMLFNNEDINKITLKGERREFKNCRVLSYFCR